MVRVERYRSSYGVYVYDERGARHHRAHAHIKKRRTRVASIYLETGELYDVVEPLPNGLHDEIVADLDRLIACWEALNP